MPFDKKFPPTLGVVDRERTHHEPSYEVEFRELIPKTADFGFRPFLIRS